MSRRVEGLLRRRWRRLTVHTETDETPHSYPEARFSRRLTMKHGMDALKLRDGRVVLYPAGKVSKIEVRQPNRTDQRAGLRFYG